MHQVKLVTAVHSTEAEVIVVIEAFMNGRFMIKAGMHEKSFDSIIQLNNRSGEGLSYSGDSGT